MGKVSKIPPDTKQNIMKKHQNKTTLFAAHIYFTFAWSRNMFLAVKILISILGWLFPCCWLFCCRISPQSPSEPLRAACCSSSSSGPSWGDPCPAPIFQCCHLLGLVTQGKEGTRNPSFPVWEQLLWILALQGEGKPQRERRGVCWGHQARARTWSRDTSTAVPVCGTHTHPLPSGAECLEHYRDWET